MRLRDVIELQAIGNEFFEYSTVNNPPPTFHPPSLKNPQKVKIPTAQDGWGKQSAKDKKSVYPANTAREQALQDLIEVHKRLRRQQGKPEVAYTTPLPGFPWIQNPI